WISFNPPAQQTCRANRQHPISIGWKGDAPNMGYLTVLTVSHLFLTRSFYATCPINGMREMRGEKWDPAYVALPPTSSLEVFQMYGRGK
ncbi:MAG: hypothetical protein K8T10_14200, partial [Candidatus Eremiobacteraeota bacterium]|nr:hypothetical protein [Candidatus Eremiobacteraeota bacterium]